MESGFKIFTRTTCNLTTYKTASTVFLPTLWRAADGATFRRTKSVNTDDQPMVKRARDQLGHTTVTMTEAYIRDRKGKKVMPTK